MAVQVLRGSQVLLLSAPALRPRVVRPSPSRGLRVPSLAARRERSPPKSFLQDGAGGAGLGSGAVPEEEVSGREVQQARGRPHSDRQGPKTQVSRRRNARAPRRQRRQGRQQCQEPGEPQPPQPALLHGSSAALQRGSPLKHQPPPWLVISRPGPEEVRAPESESHLTVLRPGSASRRVGRPRDHRPASAPPPQGWGGHPDHRPDAAADRTQPNPGFLHTQTSVGRTDATERPTSSSP